MDSRMSVAERLSYVRPGVDVASSATYFVALDWLPVRPQPPCLVRLVGSCGATADFFPLRPEMISAVFFGCGLNDERARRSERPPAEEEINLSPMNLPYPLQIEAASSWGEV